MIDALAGGVLHLGTGHPNTLWIAVTAVGTFAAGVGVGRYSRDRGAESDATEPAIEE